MDTRYGTLSQKDPQFKSLGIVRKDGDPGLCGPVCVYNALYKILNFKNGAFEDFAAVQTVYTMVTEILPQMGVPTQQIIQHGTESTVLAGLTQKLLNESKSDLHVTFKYPVEQILGVTNVKVGTDIKIGDLQGSVFNNQATIILLAPFYTTDVANMSARDLARVRKNGHYVVVVGFDWAEPRRIFLLDPERPDALRSAMLEPIKPLAFEGSTFRVRLEDIPEPAPTILIEAAIKIGSR